jgi:phosphatidylglycerol:prolipoprotein diacylglycerol transferase
VDNVAFTLFGFQIYWYGILAATAFVLGFGTAARRAPRAGVKGEEIFNLAPWIIIGAVVGARTLFVISYWDQEFAGRPLINVLNVRSGLVFYGGLIGSSLGTIIYCRRHKLNLWRIADIFAPSVVLGHGIGRIGCFMTGCCYGKECSLPWAVHFPLEHWTRGVGVHPTQLYEAVLNISFYVLLAWIFQRRKFDGQVFAIYLMGYSMIRAFVESFRGDYTEFYLGGLLTPGQTVSLIIFIAGVVLWFILNKTKVRGTASPAT